MNEGYAGGPAGGQASAGLFNACVAAARRLLNGINGRDVYAPQLAGIMSMIVTIPSTARTAGAGGVPYPKSTTANLLARTDFAAILGLLPNRVRAALSRRHATWGNELLALVRTEANDPTIALASTVFPNPIDNKPQIQLTLGEWFSGLVAGLGVDTLTEENYPHGDDEGEQLESLGAFGDRTDAPLRNQARRPIFEFRQLPAVASNQLADRALGVWDYIMRLHGRNNS